MEDKVKIWKDEEVEFLFKEVEKCKNDSIALRFAFENHAKFFNRKANSVRNYYYHEVENLIVDKTRCDRLGIDINRHKKVYFTGFDKNDEEILFEKVEALLSQGESVRSACQKLSGGNIKLMTRYQNKYQNMKRKASGAKKKENIIPFKQNQKTLTESDINSLFLGLVKLIRKNVLEDYMEKDNLQKLKINKELKHVYEELENKNRQLEDLKQKFDNIKSQNKELIEKESKINKRDLLKNHLNQSSERYDIEDEKI